MGIRGNNALIVNPIPIPVSIYLPLYKFGHCGDDKDTMDEAWNLALSAWNSAEWIDVGSSVLGFGALTELETSTGKYHASITAHKIRIQIDLTAYDPADYISAHLVVKPRKYEENNEPWHEHEYYNEQGWIEDKYDFLKEVTDKLGTEWISDEYYAPAYTPSRPKDPTVEDTNKYKGWEARRGAWTGIYIALIPKT